MYRHGLVFLRTNTQSVPVRCIYRYKVIMFAFPKKTYMRPWRRRKNAKLKFYMFKIVKILFKAKLEKIVSRVFIPLWHNCLFMLEKIRNFDLFFLRQGLVDMCGIHKLVHGYQMEYDFQLWNPIQLGHLFINTNIHQHLIWVGKKDNEICSLIFTL